MTNDSEPQVGTGELFSVMDDFFTKDAWPTHRVENQEALSSNFQGTNGRWALLARADQARELVLVYSYCPTKADVDKRPLIADYITRANYGLYIGNFELDYNDGEIRFKTSLDVEGSALDFELMKRLVYNNVGVMDRYLPGLMSVLFGGESPQAAIAKIEAVPQKQE